MAARLGLLRGGLLLLQLAACATPGAAYIYDIHFGVADEASSQGMESGITLSEGPMFASFAAPFGGGESTISVDWLLTVASQSAQRNGVTDAVNVHVAFLDAGTRAAVGLDTVGADNELTREYCCTQSLVQDCGPGIMIGGLIQHPGPSGRRAAVTSWEYIPTKPAGGGTGPVPPSMGNATYAVKNEGSQWMLAIVCDSHGTFALPDGAMDIRAAFKNPHGYLPGQYYGMLPWTGTLFVVYLVFAGVYSALFCMRRKHVIGLQWLVLAVIYLGALEMAVSFGMYESKNKSGIPTPCNVCPVTSDYLASVVLAVFKRTFSRVLLLAVAKGYGVVHANLPWKTWLGILSLGLLYLVFGCLNEVEKETSYGLQPSGWELPVFVIDAFSFVYIYGGFADMRRYLAEGHQHAKRNMYDQLWRVILSQVWVYVIVAAVVLAVRLGAMPFPWKSLFFLAHFWDLLYLIVLAGVAYIWRPGPDTAQYAYYAQPPSSADEAEADGHVFEQGEGPEAAEAVAYADTAGIEMTSPQGAAGAAGGTSGAGGGVKSPSRKPGTGGGTKIRQTGRVGGQGQGQGHGIPPDDAFVIEATDDDSGIAAGPSNGAGDEEDEADGDLSRGRSALASGAGAAGGGAGGSAASAAQQPAGQRTGPASSPPAGGRRGGGKEDQVRLAGATAGQTVDDRPLTEGASSGSGSAAGGEGGKGSATYSNL